MARPLSMDLRERVVARRRAGDAEHVRAAARYARGRRDVRRRGRPPGRPGRDRGPALPHRVQPVLQLVREVFGRQMVAWSGTFWPTLKPKRSAVTRPTMAAVRVLMNASF